MSLHHLKKTIGSVIHWDLGQRRGCNTTSSWSRLSSAQRLRRLTRTALFLGILTVLGSSAVGYIAYRTSWNATLASVFHSNLTLARTLGKYVEALEQSKSHTQVMSELQRLWDAHAKRFPGSYLCVSQSDATLALHTARPEAVGTDVGRMALIAQRDEDPQNLGELTTAKRDWVGYFTSLQGQRQVASFAYLPRLGGLLAIHVPVAEIEAQIRTTTLPWAGGLALITIVLFPAALGLLHRAYALSQRTVDQGLVALQEREARTRAILETTVDAIITIDAPGIVESFNPTAERMFGYRADEVIGQNIRILMPSPYREQHDGYLAHYLDTGERKIIGIGREVVGRRKDGTTFPMDLAVSEVSLDDRRIFTGIVRDITERKRAEEALRQAHDELEQRVQERTAELAVANEELRRFAYIVSHDLRAPLINLKGFAAELRDGYEVLNTTLPQVLPHLDEPERVEVARIVQEDGPEALGFIDSSVTRMDRLIRAILTLSRTGRRDLHIEPINTEALVHDIVQSLTHQWTERQAHIAIGSLPEIQADRTAMEQIFGNLLSNAVTYLDAARRGEITVTTEHDANFTTFHVQDNGRGIAEDDIPKVFDLFRRVGKQDTQGEGIGLTYVQTLVRRHGGDIRCQSTIGVGTTFTLTISNHLAQENTPAN